MTFTIDSVIIFDGDPISNSKDHAIAKHEIAGSDTAWTQAVGQKTQDISLRAVVEAATRTSLAALDQSTTHTFSDDVTGLSGETVWMERYSEQELAPDTWLVEMTLVRRGN